MEPVVNSDVVPVAPAAPVAAPIPAAAAPVSSEAFDFESFNTDFEKDGENVDSEAVPMELAVAPKAAPISEVVQAAPAIETPTVSPVAPITPAPVETTPKLEIVIPPTPVPATPQPIPASYTPEQIAAEREKLTQQYEQQYAMTEDEGTEVLRAPHEMLPKLAAKMHVQVTEATLVAIQQLLPQLLNRELKVAEDSRKARETFFGAWPGLNKPEHMDTLVRVGNSYRANNPGASIEQYIQEVGAMASILCKVPPGSSVVPTAPAAALAISSFTPAMPGGGTAAPASAPKLNTFETMAVEFINEDRS